ncbi:MAG: DNA translocase FtsK 4TM domain-containing protein [Candidatus Delongbacteria bacterium]|nr:DNA translocase FtsK 4TM domain-containing protein [Candidatus Delongbacteria bacterium]
MPQDSRKYHVWGVIQLISALFVLISLASYTLNDYALFKSNGLFYSSYHNYAGSLGAWISYWLFQGLGYPAFLVVLLLFSLCCYNLIAPIRHKKRRVFTFIGIFLMVTCLLVNLIEIHLYQGLVPGSHFHTGGKIFHHPAKLMIGVFGPVGSYLILLAIILLAIVFLTEWRIIEWLANSIHSTLTELGQWIKTERDHPPKVRNVSDLPSKSDPPIKIFNFEDEKKKNRPVTPSIEDDQSPVPTPPRPIPALNDNEESIPPIVRGGSMAADLNRAMENSAQPDDEEILPNFEIKPAPISSPVQHPSPRPAPPSAPKQEESSPVIPESIGSENPVYSIPQIDIIPDPPGGSKPISKIEIHDTSGKLESKLKEFGIESRVVTVSPGPIVTLYEIKLAPGVKVNKILGLVDDLSMALLGRRVRIIAPLPGKDSIGIEVPNRNPEIVYFKEIIRSNDFKANDKPLMLGLGKTASGEPFSTSLANMPHLLIAGSTGSGKSVCLNTILCSFLFKMSPKELRLILIDPKMIEFSIYNDIPHLLTPVVTNPKNAVGALKWTVTEMEDRYRMLAKIGVRNISDYNQKVDRLLHDHRQESELEKLSYIVVIIDEFADLMITASGEIEESVTRLSQMARAVGIHLILATQRPSVNVITGVIKANFPTRIAFQVAQRNDSRTILDMNGAEQLLGRGDMLFLPPGKPMPYRIHGAFISTEETESLVNQWKKFMPQYESIFDENDELGEGPISTGDRDSLFIEAAKLVILHQQGSTSLLQRRLKIGYARAARIVDQLEEAGIVGPNDGSKAREVLVDMSYVDTLNSD